jgi:catechol 2,3-dioxygenase-like lactoylglutathione lyase family enzyme
MPIKGIDHVDLAVSDVKRSLDFYLAIFGPLGAEEAFRYPTYRGTEDVTYLRFGPQVIGFRAADGGKHHYYDVGIEHLAVLVSNRQELEATYDRCLRLNVKIHFPPQEDRDIPGYWELFFFDPDGFRIEVAYYPEGVSP